MGPYSLKLVTAPSSQAITLADAKKQVEIASSIDYHDEHLTRCIKAATQQAQIHAGRQILTATYRLTLDDFPSDRISLPMPPLIAVTHIKYYDANGTEQTLATTVYKALTDCEPGQIVLKHGQDWPTVYDEPGSVAITYTAGEAATLLAAGAHVEWIKQAILLLTQAYFLRDLGKPYQEALKAAENILESHRCGDDFVRYGDE